MPKRGNLVPALAISLLLHGLMLWPAATFRSSGDAVQPLAVVLRPAPAPAVSPPAKKPLARAEENRGASSPLPQQETATPAASSAPATSTRSTAEKPLRSGPSANHPNDIAGAAPAAALSAAGAGIDAEGVRQYRLALASQARRYRRYPARAMEENIGGTVEIRVAVAAGGLPQEVLLARSSGHDPLDEAALDMMKKAAPRTAVPELLRGRAFVVSLPVVFDPAGE